MLTRLRLSRSRYMLTRTPGERIIYSTPKFAGSIGAGTEYDTMNRKMCSWMLIGSIGLSAGGCASKAGTASAAAGMMLLSVLKIQPVRRTI